MTRIERIHWGRIGIHRFHSERGILFGLWPEPIDSDACFEKAGFERFADSDETWDIDFEGVLQSVLTTLASHGNPSVTGDRPVWRQSLVARLLRKQVPELRVAEHLALVSHDDQFAPCRVDFGTPVRAVAFVSDGHPIVWIWLDQTAATAWPEHLKAFACDRDILETILRWEHLLPASLPFSAEQ